MSGDGEVVTDDAINQIESVESPIFDSKVARAYANTLQGTPYDQRSNHSGEFKPITNNVQNKLINLSF